MRTRLLRRLDAVPPPYAWGGTALICAGLALAAVLAPPVALAPRWGLGGWAVLAFSAVWLTATLVPLRLQPPISLSADTIAAAFLTPWLGWPRALLLLVLAMAAVKGAHILTARLPHEPRWVSALWGQLGAPASGAERAAWRRRWRRPRPIQLWQPLASAAASVLTVAGVWALAARVLGDPPPAWAVPAITAAAWTTAEAVFSAVLLAALDPAARARFWDGGVWRAQWRAGIAWGVLLPAVSWWLRPVLGAAAALVPAALLWRFGQARAAETTLSAAEAARRMAEADALHDALTGLPNRRAWDAYLARVADAGLPAAVAIADVDHFKAVNDTWGHAAGDAVLTDVAQRLARACRTDRGPWPDLVARLGGEEFGLLLPQMPHGVASTRVEAIRRAVGATPVSWQGRAIPVTVSAGAHWSPDAADLHQALAQADHALYRAKARGRDQTAWEPALLTPPPVPQSASGRS
jgi:diguanylate cyclase (GGDEF)-like protein